MKTLEEKAKEAFVILGDKYFNLLKETNPRGDFKHFIKMAVEYGFRHGCNTAFEWISVEDELPKEHKFGISKDVLTLAGSKHSVKNYDHIIKQWSGSQNITVTHWRPINND